MLIDLELLAKLLSPAVSLLGLYIAHTNRAKLICFFIHASEVAYGEGEKRARVHMHSYLVRNRGRKTATNVRILHQKLPYFSIYPPRPHTTEKYEGGEDILIGALVPGDGITISYLYNPDTYYHQVNRGVTSDDGLARQIEAVPQPMFPRPVIWGAQILMVLGASVLLYPLMLLLIRWLASS